MVIFTSVLRVEKPVWGGGLEVNLTRFVQKQLWDVKKSLLVETLWGKIIGSSIIGVVDVSFSTLVYVGRVLTPQVFTMGH